jgi:parvulin-like peptidyl-prolyl isomerase
MKAALEKATFDVPDGGVSEIVDTAQALIVVKVLAHHRPEVTEVTAEIKNKLQQQKLDAEIDTMKRKAGVWMDEDYFKQPVATSSAGQPASSEPRYEP